MYCVWQVIKTPTIILNNPVLSALVGMWNCWYVIVYGEIKTVDLWRIIFFRMLEMSNRTVFASVSKATYVSTLSVACFLSLCLATKCRRNNIFLITLRWNIPEIHSRLPVNIYRSVITIVIRCLLHVWDFQNLISHETAVKSVRKRFSLLNSYNFWNMQQRSENKNRIFRAL